MGLFWHFLRRGSGHRRRGFNFDLTQAALERVVDYRMDNSPGMFRFSRWPDRCIAISGYSAGGRTMNTNDVFILEDDLTMRMMLKAILEKAGYRSVFFADGEALQIEARQNSPVCILLDVCVPGKSGLETLSELRDQGCPAPILMISGHGDIATAVRSLRFGAADFIEKPFRPDTLIERIETACAGARSAASAAAHFKHAKRLTKREREVLDHMLAGLSTKLMARQLGLSPRTVEDHRANILRKAGVKSSAQLLLGVFGARHVPEFAAAA
jgi:two-component system response regulator FixJ